MAGAMNSQQPNVNRNRKPRASFILEETKPMPSNHREMANFIWRICDLLRGPYKRNGYRKVILPLTVLRRFDCLLESTKDWNDKAWAVGKSDMLITAAVTGKIDVREVEL